MVTLKAGSIPEMPLREGRLTHVDRNSTCDIWFGKREILLLKTSAVPTHPGRWADKAEGSAQAPH
jgi:hypothetical protein